MASGLDVRLHTTLRRRTEQGMVDRLSLDLPDPATVADLLRALEITLDPEVLLLVVNGKIVKTDHVLQDGDLVRLIPAMSGG